MLDRTGGFPPLSNARNNLGRVFFLLNGPLSYILSAGFNMVYRNWRSYNEALTDYASAKKAHEAAMERWTEKPLETSQINQESVCSLVILTHTFPPLAPRVRSEPCNLGLHRRKAPSQSSESKSIEQRAPDTFPSATPMLPASNLARYSGFCISATVSPFHCIDGRLDRVSQGRRRTSRPSSFLRCSTTGR